MFYKFQTSREKRENDGHAKKIAKKNHCLPIIKTTHAHKQNNNKKPSLNFFIWAMSQGLQNNKNWKIAAVSDKVYVNNFFKY